MRSVYREALRIRKPMHREPTNEELEMAECTFHPAINRPPQKPALWRWLTPCACF